ncbi:MAG: transcription elongation factor GreA [Bacteroidaceae bacterium]|nr:transcription elongation factor GreA [Bacteroidaceae bacterium]MBQ8675871.1 transcription elongation factor GreA [Bacteroidaceae bacterium]MBQ9175366.1 transcription elongation factor GreA [Bacteroidaceae bacterium]MBR1377817.1 transcription elongation factor GreA [Bacteroidaceae bacterium]MBR1379871.1 transcription elongation factor GreA [Bacteroidaceae bacterium]
MAYMSIDGYEKIRAQIKQLEEVERPEVIRQIQEAREKGDLSENAEYDAAKEAQGKLETKIAELKAILADAKIIDTSKVQTDSVQILSRVEMKNVKTGMVMTYTIVSESEANLRENKISVATPIAQGLLGKKVGDIASIKIPQGVIELEITNISV